MRLCHPCYVMPNLGYVRLVEVELGLWQNLKSCKLPSGGGETQVVCFKPYLSMVGLGKLVGYFGSAFISETTVSKVESQYFLHDTGRENKVKVSWCWELFTCFLVLPSSAQAHAQAQLGLSWLYSQLIQPPHSQPSPTHPPARESFLSAPAK